MDYKVKPTELQKATADNMIQQKVSTGRVNVGRAIKEAGGSESTSKRPSTITESKGFVKYMEENGVTEESLAKYLSSDIQELAAGERLGYLKFAAELLGLTSKDVNVNIHKEIDEEFAAIGKFIDKDGSTDK